MHVLRRDPQTLGQPQPRWRLATLLVTLDWLALASSPGLWRLLRRLHIHYKQARDYVHSPDANYEAKLALISARRAEVLCEPERFVLVYVDECTYFRQPGLARAYGSAGATQPLAYRSYRANAWVRIIGALNALTGQVTYQQQRVAGLKELPQFWQALRAAYPHAEVIYAVLDNWPIHFHPDVLACLQPQRDPWPVRKPGNWPSEPSARAPRWDLPIQLLCLPSYASWCNPIEKLWRWLRQNVLRLHRLADDWPALKQHVADALDGFRDGSSELLRYVGLAPTPT